MVKSATKSAISPTKTNTKIKTSSGRIFEEKHSKGTADSLADKSIKSTESATIAKSTTRKRKSILLEEKTSAENKTKNEPKSITLSISPTQSPPQILPKLSQSTKNQSIGNSKNMSNEYRPSIEKSSEPGELSPTKREANERVRTIIKSHIPKENNARSTCRFYATN